MRFGILGPLEISDDAGRPVAVTRRLHRSTLTLLLVNAGQPCSSTSLAAALWGDEPPQRPDVSLRSCVYGLRKVLPDAGRLRTHPSGYLIAVGPSELDLEDFRDLARRGREALDSGNPGAAAALLSQAVGLWREPPVGDLPDGQARQRLLDQRNEAQDALTDARLAVGEHRQILGQLRSVVAADPLREHAWAQLITALYRSGARAEALAAFGRLRMELISAYGIDPGPELQELHRRVLADDPALMIRADLAPVPKAAPAARPASSELRPVVPTLRPVPALKPGPALRSAPALWPGQAGTLASWRPACQLPMAVADFAGRAAELDRLLGRLSGEGMTVTVVTGVVGVGKTALAIHAAHLARACFPDGQLFACLDDGGRPRDAQVVLGELLRGLGVSAGGIPAGRFEREALYRSVLSARRVLVLADGASTAAQIRPLLPGTAGSAVVATSRARLADLDGARFIELGALDPEDSARLLARVAGAEALSAADADAATSIASACGHLPLAVRIAGARLANDPELTMAALAKLLADENRRLGELQVGDVGVRARLCAAAQGISGSAKRALALLTVAGQQESTGSVLGSLLDDADARKVAAELADAGLLHRGHGNGQFGGLTYTMHPLVRAYAGELLADSIRPVTPAQRRPD